MDVFCGCEHVSVHNNAHPLWWGASNEGDHRSREAAFFWVLVGILIRIPLCLLSLGGERSPFLKARKGQKGRDEP